MIMLHRLPFAGVPTGARSLVSRYRVGKYVSWVDLVGRGVPVGDDVERNPVYDVADPIPDRGFIKLDGIDESH